MRFTNCLNEGLSTTEITRLQESLFCVGVGVSQIKGSNITPQDLLNADYFLKSFDNYTMVDAGHDEIYSFAVNNADYVTSVVSSVNALRKSKFYSGKYNCYRTHGVMRQVYDQSARLLSKDGYKIQADKWNPGDVWLSKAGFNIPNHSSIVEFNTFISKSLKDGNLLPISLKKTKNAKVYYISSDNVLKYYRFNKVKVPTTPFNVGVVFLTDDPKMSIDCRTFGINEVASITCELLLKGSTARHSKATPLPLIKKFGIYQTPKKVFVDWAKDPMMNDVVKNNIVMKWANLGGDYRKWSNSDIEKHWQNRLNERKSMAGFYRGIINSLELSEYLMTHGDDADYFVNDTIKRALSMVSVSSDHLKIY